MRRTCPEKRPFSARASVDSGCCSAATRGVLIRSFWVGCELWEKAPYQDRCRVVPEERFGDHPPADGVPQPVDGRPPEEP
ncbi:hypothetical protein GCM10027590_27430 [Nocardiopsis nanhaiensis]